jgi:GNAT superfamily N-acetyltransferase
LVALPFCQRRTFGSAVARRQGWWQVRKGAGSREPLRTLSPSSRLVGIAHYLFHVTIWSADACYLQDLFVGEAARGQGAARALIEQVAHAAQSRGATRLYWTTQQDNARARVLYDKLARFNGFIRYEYPLT